MVGIKRLIQEVRNLEPTSPVEPLSTNPLEAAAVPLIATSGTEQASTEPLTSAETNQGPSNTTETGQNVNNHATDSSEKPDQTQESPQSIEPQESMTEIESNANSVDKVADVAVSSTAEIDRTENTS